MSVIANFGVDGSNPSRVGGLGTGIKYFPRILGPSLGVPPSTPSATNATGQLVVSNFNNELNDSQFTVRLAGNVFSGATGSNIVTPKLFVNLGSVTNPAYTQIAQAPYTAIGTSFTITNDSLTNGLATFTTSVAHGLVAGQLVSIVNTTNGGGIYNVTSQPIFSVPTSTTFTIAIGNPAPIASAADSGTVAQSISWFIEATMVSDILSATTQGYHNEYVNGTKLNGTDNAIAFNTYGTQSPFGGLVAAFQFTTSNANNSANLYSFRVVGD
jgi:hypothetical protein